ncbi:MAG: hypothetical protein WCJ57_03980 [Candidatus Falkowbacteria bacterium]
MEEVCGVEIKEPLTIGNIRDALSSCFNQVHCASTGLEGADQATLDNYCVEIVKKAFTDLGVDYANPDKEGLMKVNDFLTAFSKRFHDEKIIQEYHNKIAGMVNRLN